MSHRDASTERIGITGTNGVRNGRFRSGRVRRRMITPIATSTNANNVPMLTSSANVFSGNTNVTIATATPVTSVVRYGVRNRSDTAENTGGSRRSRHIAKNTRLWPISSTRTTDVRSRRARRRR